jgi:hypothetical protein
LQLHNRDRSGVTGTARSLVYGDGASQLVPAQVECGALGERSGSREQLDASFRKVTMVGSHQTSLRRRFNPGRPS